MTSPLTVLAVDDEAPALDELIYLLTNNESVGEVHGVSDANAALRELSEHSIDAIFLDINMPGLSGLELAAVLGNFSNPPAVVFVTAHEDKAVAAFDVGAIDYLLKPLRRERLDEAVRRVVAARTAEPQTGGDDEVVPVELAGITSLVRRDTIGWVEADGDYARLHSSSGSHLVRIPCPPWKPVGAIRVSSVYTAPIWWRSAWSPGCAIPTAEYWCAFGRTAPRPRSNFR